MNKDQATALREMIKLKKAKKKKSNDSLISNEELKEMVVQTTVLSTSDIEETGLIQSDEGISSIKETSMENPSSLPVKTHLVKDEVVLEKAEESTVAIIETEKVAVNESFDLEVENVSLHSVVNEESTKMSEQPQPESESSVVKENEMKRLLSNQQLEAEPKEIKIMAVCSGKGGVGKSNFSLNTGLAIQEQGKNVLIIDLDVGFTNIDVLCGIGGTPYTLEDVIEGRKTLKEAIVTGPNGIQFIAGGSDALGVKDLNEDHKKIFKEQLLQLENIDVILIDMGAGVTRMSLLYTMFAQELILLATPEPTSVTDAYAFLRIIDQYQLKNKVKVVLNRVSNEKEALNTFELLKLTTQKFLKLDLNYLGCIRDDKDVQACIKAQKPFLIKAPKCLASSDVRLISRELMESKDGMKKPKTMKEVVQRFFHVFG